eukprot:19313-Pelagococcus_subviridis.AAC.4
MPRDADATFPLWILRGRRASRSDAPVDDARVLRRVRRVRRSYRARASAPPVAILIGGAGFRYSRALFAFFDIRETRRQFIGRSTVVAVNAMKDSNRF